MKKLDEVLLPFKERRDMAIPALQAVQERLGYLPMEAIEGVAHALGLPPGEVYGVATFYVQFRLKPIGENIITVG